MKCLLIALLFISTVTARAEDSRWIVVGNAEALDAIEPLAEHRRQQGYDVKLFAELSEKLVRELRDNRDFLFILGDDVLHGEADAKWSIPGKRRDLYRWTPMQRAKYLSDAAWGDLDNDGVPDVAVGRVPARTTEEVAAYTKKVIAYEKRGVRLEDLSLPVWGGAPNYNTAIDSLSTSILRKALNRDAPLWAEPWLISADKTSAFCAWPADHSRLFNERIERGGVMIAMLGHGAVDEFFSIADKGEWVVYGRQEIKAADKGDPDPPLFMFACDCGDFGHKKTSLAERFLQTPGGPVAVVAATTESHPLTNYYSSTELLKQLHHLDERTLGRVWLKAQRNAVKASSFFVEMGLKNAEGSLEKNINVAKLKADQLLMYAVLGDPAVPFRLPRPLGLNVEPVEGEKDIWKWSATPPKGVNVNEVLVFHRKPIKRGEPRPADADRETSLKLFEKRNSIYRFESVGFEKPLLTGVVRGRGALRVVVVADGELFVAAAKLR